ncbi:MAG: PqqD family protein [Jatrophihabitantaceae bacterium]
MTALDAQARPRRRLGLWLRRQHGLIPVGYRDIAVESSGTAQLLFENADGSRTLHQLAGLLVAEYGISSEDALADTAEFIGSMIEHQLMVIATNDASPTP